MNINNNIKPEQLLELLENDDLRRNKYLYNFIKIISYNGYNQIISLDGEWGSGKTIFVKKLELLINYFSFYNESKKIDNKNYINKKTELNSEIVDRLSIIGRVEIYKNIKQIVKDTNINAIYFNAWEHDDEEDPIVSIIYEIVNNFNLVDSTKKLSTGNFAENLKSLINLLSLGNLSLGTLIDEKDLAASLRLKDDIKNSLNKVFNNIINGNCDKLVIFIDELDRCKPEYAINLLERIKHYINDDRIVIVLSTNIKELTHIISTKYGNGFSSEEYLDKFIDEKLYLPKVDLDDFLKTFENNIINNTKTWVSTVTKYFIEKNSLSMRQINRYMECMKHFEKYLSANYIPFERHLQIIDTLFLPYMVGLYNYSPTNYIMFISGKGENDFNNFVSGNEHVVEMCKYIFYGDASNIKKEDILNDLNKYYDLLFNERSAQAKIEINGIEIYKYSLQNIYDKISLLGDIANFEKK